MTVIRIETGSADPQQRSVRGPATALSLAVVAGYIPLSLDLPHRVMRGAHLMAPTCGLGRPADRCFDSIRHAISFNSSIVPLVAVIAAGAVRELVGRWRQRWLTLSGRPQRGSMAVWQQYRFHCLVSQRL